ncbi:MAG TPA: tetratricopeptide repeat protein [Tenuifilaceae bacterium]|nr:tetratricopeptide repeat protein [Tenuifilaceae bacterium]HPE19537.1 tetratricopeptide repeat protein [Tenuifilaceae bacterium]HPJ46592.1 tetratricopeptide repeat protein [Tenuifilaceae bacterium]HPQ35599.1 tetratricopeptide repeat protein [Tenuifilaceae bacterium]HRX69141.1 tetratricopeptide repeat protein [Tenuifilaceae bacterium]
MADSIRHELSKSNIDTASFNQLLFSIRKNRKQLNEQYKPLLIYYIEQTKKQEYKQGQMQALDRLGLQERYEENYEKAIEYHQQSMELATELKDSMQLTYNFNNIAQAYRKRDLNALAIRYFHKALRIQEQIGDTRGTYFTQNTLGATYLAQEDYDKAKYYLLLSLNQAIKHNDKRTISYNYGSLGEVYLELNQVDSALHYFELGKTIKNELNLDKGLAVSDHLIGQALYAKKDFSNAEKSFRQALQMHIKYKNERYQALCLAYLGKIELALGNLDSAEEYLKKAKTIAHKKHSIENLVTIEDALFQLYKQKGMHGKAYNALNSYHAYRDSILQVKAQRNIQSLDVEYQTQQREQEIEMLSKDNFIKNQRIRLGLVLLVLLSFTLFLGVALYLQRRRNSKMVEANLQHKLSRSQMNPHFVSNAMSSIQSFMYKNNPDEAAKYLGKFANLNRAVLEHSLVDSIPLEEEVAMLSSYLEFEQLRFNNAFFFTVNIDEELDTEIICIPPLFIQPFVENAVKHGVKDLKGNGRIEVSFTDCNEFLKVEVTDNGSGYVPNKNSELNEHHSRSTEIVNKRLALLRAKYKNLPNITITGSGINIEEGTCVTIYLPILSC